MLASLTSAIIGVKYFTMLIPRYETLMYQLVGRRIRNLRQNRFTQEELADLVDVSRTSITNLESGQQRPPLHLLLRIASALDCELHDLLPTRKALGLTATSQSKSREVRVIGDLTPATRELLQRYVNQGENSDETR